MENKVLATVNGKEITQQDFDNLLNSLGPQRAMQFQNEAGQKQLLDELIHQELFFFSAKEEKLEESEEFLTELEAVKENLLKQFGIRKLLNTVSVEADEAKTYYETNGQLFQAPESVQASHILVDTEEKANEVSKKIEEGSDFADLAKEYSSCPSKENGGDLGFFEKGKMVPEFENVAFEMDVEQISGVVKTQFGFHIIKVTGKKEASTMSFEDVAGQIEHNLLLQKQQAVYMEKIENLKETYKVDVK